MSTCGRPIGTPSHGAAMTFAQIAIRMGLSERTVYADFRRGMSKLQTTAPKVAVMLEIFAEERCEHAGKAA